MMTEISAKTFYKQLTGDYAGGMTAVTIATGIVGFCAIFCGTQLGWTHLFTIIGLIALAFCIGLLIFFIVKTVRMKQHPVFRRYGSAPILAEKIIDGMQHPRYFVSSSDPSVPFSTLMTNEFIVSGLELVSYTELKDIRSVQPAYLPETRTRFVNASSPAALAGSLAANYAADRYIESKNRNANSSASFDYLIMEDTNGKKHRYGVRRMDMEAMLNLLREIAPHIQIIPEGRPLY